MTTKKGGGINISLIYNRNYIVRAKRLRKNMTRHERHLWYDFLSGYPVRFQRQKVIGNYIVDFYCHKAKLVIELDGSQHYRPRAMQYDKIRTEFLESLSLEVIRFPNTDIDKKFGDVCFTIDKIVKQRENKNEIEYIN